MFITTVIEKYYIDNNPILVKREDMAALPPAPPFSKVRGIIPALEKLKKQGITTIGYTETSISMAGWGLAWACVQLGLKALIFDPQYKKTPSLLKFHRKQWKVFGAETIPIKAGMARVNYHISKNLLKKYPNSIMVDLGMPFEETVEATCLEAKKCFKEYQPTTVVINVGSGTICAGVLKAANNKMAIWGVLGRTGNLNKKKKNISRKAEVIVEGLLQNRNLYLTDPGWEYTDKSKTSCPFPCHPYYDKKAWEWLKSNIKTLAPPVLFWNIGH